MAQASKNQATASKTAKSAKPAAAPAVVEEVLEDEDVLDVDDVEPDMSSTEAASDEKPESNINEDGEEQDLLEGIPEEELKAASDVSLPKVRTKKTRSSVRKRNEAANVTMLTGDPVRMYLKEIGKVPRPSLTRPRRRAANSSAERSAVWAVWSRWASMPSSSSSRRTCVWSCPSPSVMSAAACCFWTLSRKATLA